MPRFVVLEHDHPVLHWDLMLETGDVLRTWKLTAPPEPGRVIAASYLFEHRRMYLDYEGPVSGDRGRVKRWDAGTYSWLEDADERVVFEVAGGRVRGIAQLIKKQANEWIFELLFSKSADRPGPTP
jgi:hypothetical protein